MHESALPHLRPSPSLSDARHAKYAGKTGTLKSVGGRSEKGTKERAPGPPLAAPVTALAREDVASLAPSSLEAPRPRSHPIVVVLRDTLPLLLPLALVRALKDGGG